MSTSQKNSSSVDIFDLLSGVSEDREQKKPQPVEEASTQRQELLATTKAKDLFPKGTISINNYTCVGVQCKLCIKACPTNALYWTNNGKGVIEDLCLHCEACVLSCMVDDCIKITRKREDATEERFSKPRDVLMQTEKLNAEKTVFNASRRIIHRRRLLQEISLQALKHVRVKVFKKLSTFGNARLKRWSTDWFGYGWACSKNLGVCELLLVDDLDCVSFPNNLTSHIYIIMQKEDLLNGNMGMFVSSFAGLIAVSSPSF